MLYFACCLTAHLNNKLKSNKFVFILTCLGNIRSTFLHYIMLLLRSHVWKQSCPLRAMQKYLPCYKSLPADTICSFRWTEMQIQTVIFVFFIIFLRFIHIMTLLYGSHGVNQQMYSKWCFLRRQLIEQFICSSDYTAPTHAHVQG